MNILGNCHSRFRPVYDVFQQHFSDQKEKGAALAVWFRGELVVNLWGGTRDKAETQAWTENTLVNVFSTSKMISAICVQHALDSGNLDLHRPVKDVWPEYNCHGKGDTTLAWMLNHRSGLPAIREPVADEALFDWDYMCARLAQETPWWQPGKQHGYHMVTFGWLVGEVFRRAMGVTLGQYLRSEIAEPLGLDVHMGVKESECELADLFAPTHVPAHGRIHLFEKAMSDRGSVTAKALLNPSSLMSSSNKKQWREMELPSANVHTNACSLATMMGLCLQGGELLSAAGLQRLLTRESHGFDPVLTTSTCFGPGVMLQLPGDAEASFGPMQQAFGHPGSGGALAFADPENQIGFAYVMNQMGPYLMVDPRPRALAEAFYSCLD